MLGGFQGQNSLQEDPICGCFAFLSICGVKRLRSKTGVWRQAEWPNATSLKQTLQKLLCWWGRGGHMAAWQLHLEIEHADPIMGSPPGAVEERQ